MILNGITLDRLHDRAALRASIDRFRREADASGQMEGLDVATRQAFGVLTSSRLAEALDLSREPKEVQDRYGYGSPEPAGYGDAGPLLNTYFLTARRLIEAGVRCVTLAYGRWDWHGKPHGTTFENARHHLPMLDQGVSALVEDLHQRGLDKDVSVIVWGEFGRTPKINANAGRDHWPPVSCALLAGGGNANRPGDRFDRPRCGVRSRSSGSLPGNLRHALPPAGDRCPHRDPHRPQRPTAVSCRSPGTDPRVDLTGATSTHVLSLGQFLDRFHERLGLHASVQLEEQ
jgi:hypothetical protein